MRIVVAADLGTTGHSWLMERAVHYAHRLSARVDTLYVHSPGATNDELDSYHSRLDGLLEQVVEERRGQPRLVGGAAAETLIDISQEYDLLMVGPREPPALERVLLGPMSVRVLRRAHCPVLVPRSEPLPRGTIRMLVGIDVDGELGAEVLQLAAKWAERLDGHLDAVYATSDTLPPIKNREVRERAEREWAAAREPRRQALASLLAGVPQATRGEARLRAGEPEDALVSLSDDYHAVIVGNRERKGIAGWVLGTVAHHVARNAHCDVLTLPTADLE